MTKCDLRRELWRYLNRTLVTCGQRYREPTEDKRFLINSTSDTEIQGFDIYNKIDVEFIPENLSEKFPNLIGINVFNCSIKTVTKTNFKGLNKLVIIGLSNNKIETIESGTFKDTTKVEKLALANNNIKQLPNDLFESLLNLKILYLHNNQITVIHPQTFKNLKSLETIAMPDNGLKLIDPKVFDNLNSLTSVGLEGNACINEYFNGSERIIEMKAEIKKKCQGLHSPILEALQ
jgi:Leucine-rich repeat (LRR) protein